jgi:hypothetical protein
MRTAGWDVDEVLRKAGKAATLGSMQSVLLIVAPFGFGPAVKGLHVLRSLADRTDVTLVSDGDAYDFMASHISTEVSCRRGRVNRLFTPAQINQFDLIVSVNNVPAVRALTRIGMGEKVVLIDSLAHWRPGRDEIMTYEPIRAYVVQDFPGAKEAAGCDARETHIVGPIVWESSLSVSSKRQGIVLNLGGVTSAVVGWEKVAAGVGSLVRGVNRGCLSGEIYLAIIGNSRIGELLQDADTNVDVLGEVDPATSANMIAGSQGLLTTPGIGTVYEGMLAGTPMLLMPPGNSTQLCQYQILSDLGIWHSLHGHADLNSLFKILSLPWTDQAAQCHSWLNDNASSVEDCVAATTAEFVRETGCSTDGLLGVQQKLAESLSTNHIQDVLLNMLG